MFLFAASALAFGGVDDSAARSDVARSAIIGIRVERTPTRLLLRAEPVVISARTQPPIYISVTWSTSSDTSPKPLKYPTDLSAGEIGCYIDKYWGLATGCRIDLSQSARPWGRSRGWAIRRCFFWYGSMLCVSRQPMLS